MLVWCVTVRATGTAAAMGQSQAKDSSYLALTKEDRKGLEVVQVLDVPGDNADRHIRIVFEDISGRRESFIDKRSVHHRLLHSTTRLLQRVLLTGVCTVWCDMMMRCSDLVLAEKLEREKVKLQHQPGVKIDRAPTPNEKLILKAQIKGVMKERSQEFVYRALVYVGPQQPVPPHPLQEETRKKSMSHLLCRSDSL